MTFPWLANPFKWTQIPVELLAYLNPKLWNDLFEALHIGEFQRSVGVSEAKNDGWAEDDGRQAMRELVQWYLGTSRTPSYNYTYIPLKNITFDDDSVPIAFDKNGVNITISQRSVQEWESSFSDISGNAPLSVKNATAEHDASGLAKRYTIQVQSGDLNSTSHQGGSIWAIFDPCRNLDTIRASSRTAKMSERLEDIEELLKSARKELHQQILNTFADLNKTLNTNSSSLIPLPTLRLGNSTALQVSEKESLFQNSSEVEEIIENGEDTLRENGVVDDASEAWKEIFGCTEDSDAKSAMNLVFVPFGNVTHNATAAIFLPTDSTPTLANITNDSTIQFGQLLEQAVQLEAYQTNQLHNFARRSNFTLESNVFEPMHSMNKTGEKALIISGAVMGSLCGVGIMYLAYRLLRRCIKKRSNPDVEVAADFPPVGRPSHG